MGISFSGIALILFVLTIILMLGLTVYLRNPRGIKNVMFLMLATTVGVWTTASSISDADLNFQLSAISSNIAFGAGFLGVCLAYLFTRSLRHNLQLKFLYLFLPPALLLSIVFSTNLVYELKSLDSYDNGPLYIPYVLSVLVFAVAIARNLRHIVKYGNALERNQARIIIFGLLVLVLGALTTNAIIPAIIDTTAITKISPVFPTFFIFAATYAVVRHQLFDVRLVVARSLGYLFSLISVGVLYGGIAFFIVNGLFFKTQDITLLQTVIYTALTVLLSFTFQPVKQFFDKITNKIFYRDAYDPQIFLDELNKVLVSVSGIKDLTSEVAAILESHVKVSECRFIFAADFGQTDNLKKSILHLQHGEEHALTEYFTKNKSNKIIADNLDNEREVRKLLHNYEIALLYKIGLMDQKGEQSSCYITFGYKKSGNQFNRSDLRILEIVVNELAIALQNAMRYEEITQFNITLQKKIDDATKEMRHTNEALKALDETKDEFISMASHQLRTPLTSVKGYVSMVLEGDAGELNDMQKKLLTQAFVSSQRMVYLIADLLNVSRLRTGKFIIEPSQTNLADVVEGEVSQLIETAQARGLTLNFAKPVDFPSLWLDETKVRQVVMNFIDNAIYYTPSGGNIEVALEDKGKSVELTVTDSGIGVPKAEQRHLFGKFYRAGNARRARPDGTGLGLFMARKVIAAQHGAIIFKSTEGKGSTFGFSFNKARLKAAAPAEPARA